MGQVEVIELTAQEEKISGVCARFSKFTKLKANNLGEILIQSTPLMVDGDAIAVFEIASIARGVVVLDQMAKRAFTEIISSKTVSGKYLIILSGSVAEIEEASFAALESMQDDHIDHIILRDPPPFLRKTCE